MTALVDADSDTAESAHQKGATDQVEAMARDLEFTRAELASAKQNLDKAHSDQSKVRALRVSAVETILPCMADGADLQLLNLSECVQYQKHNPLCSSQTCTSSKGMSSASTACLGLAIYSFPCQQMLCHATFIELLLPSTSPQRKSA